MGALTARLKWVLQRHSAPHNHLKLWGQTFRQPRQQRRNSLSDTSLGCSWKTEKEPSAQVEVLKPVEVVKPVAAETPKLAWKNGVKPATKLRSIPAIHHELAVFL